MKEGKKKKECKNIIAYSWYYLRRKKLFFFLGLDFRILALRGGMLFILIPDLREPFMLELRFFGLHTSARVDNVFLVSIIKISKWISHFNFERNYS